jgi:hypothetical protein
MTRLMQCSKVGALFDHLATHPSIWKRIYQGSDLSRLNRVPCARASGRTSPNGLADAILVCSSSEPLPCCLPRHGKRLSHGRPARLAFTEDVGDILQAATQR